MRISKIVRAEVRAKYGGLCAYCGVPLGERWHVDHLVAVERKLAHVPGKGFVATGELHRPENDRPENFMPACPPCNIDKHVMSLENWRVKLSNTLRVLADNNATYRHGLRFGLIEEKPGPVVFHFERVAAEMQASSRPNELTFSAQLPATASRAAISHSQ